MALVFIIPFGIKLGENFRAVFDHVTSPPVGKEEKTAMKIAFQDFNLSLFVNPGRDPLKATITGASVAAIGNRVQILPFATSSAPLTRSSLGHPFLAKLTVNDFEYRKCFATNIHVDSWSRDIPIFQEEAYVVFILEPSYGSRVSAILTFQQLEPNITDIERLQKAKSDIGFAGDSFLKTYFEEVLGFEKQNIENGSSKYKYEGRFRSINGAAAAFLELPDEKAFFSQRRNQFIAAAPTYFFPGFSFAFKKGSPIAADVSRDVRKLYEYETIQSLVYSSKHRVRAPDIDCCSLQIQSFRGLYLIFGATSTVCLLLFLIDLTRSYCCDQDETEDDIPPC
ncbi:hypothetical protein PTKIN_Ptkin18bG0115900 [Pterospermum kingtungense]